MTISKGDLRRRYLMRRRNFDLGTRRASDDAIRERVLAMPAVAEARCVVTYVGTPPEVDTRGIIEALLAQGKRVLAPVMSEDDGMRWGDVKSLDALVRGAFHFLEPSADMLARCPDDAPVLVPLVAFTAAGDRLGRGGGHFDRFLAGHRGAKIGLAYECQLADEIPVEPHDARLDFVVTETKIWAANGG